MELSRDLWAHLGAFIDLPRNCIEATIRLRVDKVVEIECKVYPQREIRVTNLDSRAQEYTLEHGPIESKRYRLEEIK